MRERKYNQQRIRIKKRQTTRYLREHAYTKIRDHKVSVKGIFDKQDQNELQHTRTKEATHHENKVRKTGGMTH